MDESPGGDKPPHHGAVKIYDRPKSVSKFPPSVLGVALTMVILIVLYALYRHFAH